MVGNGVQGLYFHVKHDDFASESTKKEWREEFIQENFTQALDIQTSYNPRRLYNPLDWLHNKDPIKILRISLEN